MLVKLAVIDNCHKCPHSSSKLTKGYGYACDYFCKLTGRTTAGYVEWNSDMRKDGDFPAWCPLEERNSNESQG